VVPLFSLSRLGQRLSALTAQHEARFSTLQYCLKVLDLLLDVVLSGCRRELFTLCITSWQESQLSKVQYSL